MAFGVYHLSILGPTNPDYKHFLFEKPQLVLGGILEKAAVKLRDGTHRDPAPGEEERKQNAGLLPPGVTHAINKGRENSYAVEVVSAVSCQD